MEKWRFNLQRFGESGDDSSGEAADMSIDTTVETDTTTEVDSDATMGVVVNPQTGKRSVQMISEGTQETTEGTQETTEGAQENIQAASGNNASPYTAQELILAAQLGTVNESRIPDEYKEEYAAYKQRQEQPPPVQPIPPPQETQAPPPDPKEFYKALADTALKNTLTELGMTAEDYATLEYNDDPNALKVFESAYQANTQRLINQVQAAQYQVQAQQNEQRAIYDEIGAFVTTVQKEESNFDAIDVLMASRYKTLPYEKAAPIAQALDAFSRGVITRAQLPVLEEYYKDTRAEFYAKENGLSRTPVKKTPPPPHVEGAGSGAKLPEIFDFTKLREMGRKDKSAYIGNYLRQFSN